MSYTFYGIDHIQLAAPENCEVEARNFFQNILGWTEIPKPEILKKRGGVWFQCGTHQVHIGVQHDFVPATKAHPAFHVQNLEALKQRLKDNQIRVIDDHVRDDEGVYRFYVNDPFGNRLEFMEWFKS
ncbi:VOC family protein [Paenibacillus xylanilyticus]|uniref:Glyoxalase n=1 Tax=Paenibacillus xylanilyticus TaxID=248903 RepID=A0A7Y6BXN1_9BACL|nr:VOC family protein [Paenibacillus xylanilyticus]NUU76381.1 glyoxalase [Paenibacillus xylanilyticus]